MNTRRRQVGYPFRLLRRTPGFTISVVLALAIGMGLGIPVLTTIRDSAVRSSPYTDPLLREGGQGTDWLPGWTPARQTIADIQNEALQALLGVLLALTLLLLAIALINTVTLLLARAAGRRPEVALRAVLGAARWRLAGQLLAEGALLLVLGSGLGVLLGTGVAILLHRSWPGEAPPWGDFAMNGWIVAAVAGIFTVAPLLAWLSPVGVASRRDLQRFLTTGGRSTAGRGEAFTRQTLATIQIAASLVLLTSAGLLLRGFTSSPQENRQLGLDARDTLTVHLRLPEQQSLSSREHSLVFERVRDRVAAIPGVVDTSVASAGAWVGLGTSDLVHALTGNPTSPGWIKPARYQAVSPDFFQTLDLQVLHGREFSPADTVGAPRAVVVNQAFVNRFRLVGNGLGRSLQLHGMSMSRPWYTIVGVVEDVRAEGLGMGTEPVPKVYLSILQHPPRTVGLAVRTTGGPMRLLPAVAAAVRVAAPGAKLSGAMTMEQYLERFRAPLRWFAVLFGGLAGVALLLATIGLQGVMSYNVVRRTREIGIRMALGAQIREITRMILKQSFRIIGLGILLGLVAVSGVARLLQLLLSGVEPFDPLLIGGIAVLLGSVALLASYRPAQRAASVDPQISLRAE